MNCAAWPDGRGAERWVHRELLLLWAWKPSTRAWATTALETQRWRAVAQQDPRAQSLAVTADLVDAHLAWRSRDPMRMSMFLDRALQNAREPELSLHPLAHADAAGGTGRASGAARPCSTPLGHDASQRAWCPLRYRHQALVQMASLMYDHHDPEQRQVELMRSAQRIADATMNPLLGASRSATKAVLSPPAAS